ncbi:MAG: EF-P lysine aminoacylase GenX [Deltaproteobacteria bacterium]|nr:EF-P lysine aminoacylase GenX [Deltaproteobacteria bacterium]
MVVETRRDGVSPTFAFPKAEGDYAHFTADGGRRVANLHRRAAVLSAIRGYFDQRGFLEVETPLMVRSPGTEVHLEAFSVDGSPEGRFLITSPEMHMKRLLGAGLSKVYQISRAFRRDEAGGHHQPEFTMLEWYRGFADASAVMQDTENLVAAVAEEVCGEATVRVAGREVNLAPPWRRVRVDEALAKHAGLSLSEVLPDEERFFRAWVDKVEPALGRDRATFVTHWPASMASLARLLPDDPASADRFEAYIGGIELCNGFGELVNAREQRRRIEAEVALREAEGLPAYPIDERFLGALEEGLPDSGGNALGVDRLVMMVCGEDEVSEVMAFPADRV